MKKIIWLYCVIIAVLYVSFYSSYAIVSETVYLNRNKDILEIGEDIEVYVTLENSNIVAFNLNLYYDKTKLEYISGPENTNVIENRILYVWHDETGGNRPKNGELAKFTFRAKEEGIANFNIDGEFYNNVPELIQTEFKGSSVQIGKETVIEQNDVISVEKVNFENSEHMTTGLEKNNTDLETLAVQDILLYPPFDKMIKEYSIEVSENIKKLNILAIPENENAKVQIIGSEELNTGNNLIKIEVTAEDGKTKSEYEINAYKRNTEEEKDYIEEQEENEKKLEQIYDAQKTSGEIEVPKNSKVESISEKPDFIQIVIVSTLAILVIGIVAFKYK